MKSMEEEPNKIIRTSIFTFLKHYHNCTTAAAIALPFSAALLLSHPSSSSSFLHTKLDSLFHGAGFDSSLTFFNILSLKLSQTLYSSFITFPLSLTFFLFSKSYIIKLLNSNDQSSSFFSNYYFPILKTFFCNSLLLISANASAFAFFFLTFNLFQIFGFNSTQFNTILSVFAAILYSIILAIAFVITNLALISSPNSSGGYIAILKACVLINGRISTALALALPTNLGLAAVEALFQYRIMKSYYKGDREITSMTLEATFIGYLYSLFLVLDTIVNFLFYQSCCSSIKGDQYQNIDKEDEYLFKIEIFFYTNVEVKVSSHCREAKLIRVLTFSSN